MKIETMDSEIQSRPSVMERITTAAETAGRPISERVMKVLDRVLGAPEAVGMAVTIAGENARALQERAANALNETAHSMEEAIQDAVDQFTGWVTKTKDKGLAKARDWGARALKFGLTKATSLEDRVVAICNIPAGLEEIAAGGFEARAKAGSEQYTKNVVDLMTAKAGLSAEQRAILESLLAAQEVERQKLEEKQAKGREKIGLRVEKARGRAGELKADADNKRSWVEKQRVFKGLLAKVSV